MKHLTAILAGTAVVMAAAGLALSVYNYLSDRSEWEICDDEDCCDCDCCCGEPEADDADSCACGCTKIPAEETPDGMPTEEE